MSDDDEKEMFERETSKRMKALKRRGNDVNYSVVREKHSKNPDDIKGKPKHKQKKVTAEERATAAEEDDESNEADIQLAQKKMENLNKMGNFLGENSGDPDLINFSLDKKTKEVASETLLKEINKTRDVFNDKNVTVDGIFIIIDVPGYALGISLEENI